jgi:acyl carrier protein
VVPHQELNISEIRRYLLMSLPVYMIPASFVELDTMPLTPNGKIDRQALSGLAGNIKMEVEYEEPRDGEEKRLAEIWQNMLGLERVGRKDNFFNIGGDSIKTISILNVVNEAFAAELEILDLYQNETIEKLADVINKRKTGKHGQENGDIREDIEDLKNKFMEGLQDDGHHI